MKREPPWMEKPLHWISKMWMMLTLSGGGKSHDVYARVGIAATGLVLTALGVWMLLDGALGWGGTFLTLGSIQLGSLALHYLSRARRIS